MDTREEELNINQIPAANYDDEKTELAETVVNNSSVSIQLNEQEKDKSQVADSVDQPINELKSLSFIEESKHVNKIEEDKSVAKEVSESMLLNNEIINLDSSSALLHNILNKSILEKEEFVSDVLHTHDELDELDEERDEQLEAIAIAAISEQDDVYDENKIQIKERLNELKLELKTLTQRCDQFNDVKQSIRSINDLIKEEIFLDFGTIITMMRYKMDELTNQIKEKLKDAYSVIRDRQEKITNRLEEIKQMTEQLENETTLTEHDKVIEQLKQSREQIDQIYDELRLICDSAVASNQPAITVTATSAINSISNCSNNCSLFIDNNLYPQFNYFIDMSKLIADINGLTVQISTQNQSSALNRLSYLAAEHSSVDNNNNNNDFTYEYNENTSYYCVVTSRLGNDGSFWIKLLCSQNDIGSEIEQDMDNDYLSNSSSNKRHITKCLDKTNVFIEELSKNVRRKRIGDKNWLTYAEANRIPQPGEKCFCLEQKTRKWLRAVILTHYMHDNTSQVRFMDTGGHADTTPFNLDQILIWQDNFEWACSSPRSIKCYLALYDSTDYLGHLENEICLETKFFFKDKVANKQNLKCNLVKKINDEWIVELYDKQQAINSLIIEFNQKEKTALTVKSAKSFRSVDIRVESGQVKEIVNHMINNKQTDDNKNDQIDEFKEKDFIEKEPQVKEEVQFNSSFSTLQQNQPQQQSQIHSSSLQPSNQLSDYSDIEDQNEEHRAFKQKSGMCFVYKNITEDGIFWIRPLLEQGSDLFYEYKNMSRNIGEFIMKTQWKSFGSLNIEPIAGRKCFASINHGEKTEWFRGQLERVPAASFNNKKCLVRMLDHGFTREINIYEIYPHRRFSSETSSSNKSRSIDTKLEYLAIRCSLTPSGYNIRLNQNSIALFSKLVSDNVEYNPIKFELIEHGQLNSSNKRKFWHAELTNLKNAHEIINYIVIEAELLDQKSNLVDRFKFLQLIKEKKRNDEYLASMFSRNKQNEPLKSIQQSKSIDLLQQTQNNPNNLNLSLPTSYHDGNRLPRTKPNKNKTNKRNKERSKLNNIETARYQPTQYQPLRRKSKSFEHLIINDNDGTNDQKQNDEYHTIASGAGIAAAAAALQHSADISTKYHLHQHHHNSSRYKKESENLSTSSNNTYSSMPYNSPIHKNNQKSQTMTVDQEKKLLINSNTITIERHENIYDETLTSMPTLPSNKETKSKIKPYRSHFHSAIDSCKTDAQFYKSSRRHDDEDDQDDQHGGGGGGGRRRANTTTGGSTSAYHKSFGDRNQSQTNNKKYSGGRKNKLCDCNSNECCDCINEENIDCCSLPDQGFMQINSYIAEFNNYDNLPSSAFNDVFMPSEQKLQNECNTSDEDEEDEVYEYNQINNNNNKKRKICEKIKPRSRSCCHENLFRKVKEESLENSNIEHKRSVLNEDSNEQDFSSKQSHKTKYNDEYLVTGGQNNISQHEFQNDFTTQQENDKFHFSYNHFNDGKDNFDLSLNLAPKINGHIQLIADESNSLAHKSHSIKILLEQEDEEKENGDNFYQNPNFNNTTLLHDSTQAIAFRHMYVSPLLSADSSQKFIIDQQKEQQSNNSSSVGQMLRQRSHSDDLTTGNNCKYIWKSNQTPTTPINPNKILSSSSSSSSASSSVNKTPTNRLKKTPSSGTNKEDDENDDLYASCAEEYPENNNNDGEDLYCHIRNSSPTTLIAPLLPGEDAANIEGTTLITTTRNFNKEAQTDEMSLLLNYKREKLKKFTVSVFVDSFDDYSLNKSSSSSNCSINPDIVPKQQNIIQTDDCVDAAWNKKSEIFINSSQLIVDTHDDEVDQFASSLKEFELNEANLSCDNQLNSTTPKGQPLTADKMAPTQTSDDAFMFNSNPNNYDNLIHFKNNISLASKPPLIPNSLIFTQQQQQQQNHQIQLFNVSSSNQCLSTITECSNETFETCSNQSPINNNTSNRNNKEEEEDGEIIMNSSNDEKNITFRKKLNSKKCSAIDKIFEEFCLAANDEIMMTTENTNNDNHMAINNAENSFTMTSSESNSALTTIQQQQAYNKSGNKINSKLLNEILNADIDTPSFSSSSSSFSVSKTKNDDNIKKKESLSSIENKNNNNNNIRSSGGGLDTNAFEIDEVEDEVFLKSNHNQLKTGSSVSSSSSINNINKLFSSSSSSSSSPLPQNDNNNMIQLSPSNNGTVKVLSKNKTNMNVSSATTLEISSYTSDSLFNSNLIITPICSDAVSPFNGLNNPNMLQMLNNTNQSLSLFNNNLFSSQQSQQQSPIMNTTPNKVKDLLRLQASIQYLQKQQQTPSPPPLPPLPTSSSITNVGLAVFSPTFPSPPKLNTIQSPFSESTTSLPPPPPPPPEFFTNQDQTTLKINKNLKGITSDNKQKAITNQPNKKDLSHQVKPKNNNIKLVQQQDIGSSSTRSLIESLTARLNLASINRVNSTGNINEKPKSQQSIQRPVQKTKILSPPKINNSTVNSNLANIITKNNNINKMGYASIGSLFKANLQKSSVMVISNNQHNKSGNNENEDDLSEQQQWKAANLSLYGLDTEDYDENNNSEINNNNRLIEEEQESYENDNRASFEFPPPPPPNGFEDNNITGNNRSEASFKTPSSTASNNNQRFIPPLPTFQSSHIPKQKINSQASASFEDALYSKVKVKHQPNTSLNLTSNTSKKFWNNISSSDGTTEPPLATTSLGEQHVKPIKNNRDKLDLNNNDLIDLREQDQSKRLLFNQSCPTVLYRNSYESYDLTVSESISETSSDSYFKPEDDLSGASVPKPFKLDHLVDINPKRLYESCKFRAKIHDIIDEHGQFWLEVIYSKEDELKFSEIFRLFRLCSKISEPPKHLYVQKFVSAFYKDNWHRAIVVEISQQQMNANKILVRFLDLGVTKLVDRFAELREIDEKFFNCPLKALHCTICLDHSDTQNSFKLTKEARKFFTRLIYKRILFVKLVGFVDRKQNQLQNLLLHHDSTSNICKVILGCQTQRGIIDVCMYLLSKFDRKRYETLKNRDVNHYTQPEAESVATTTGPISSSMSNLKRMLNDQNLVKSTSTSYLCLPTPSTNNVPSSSRQQQQFYYDEVDAQRRLQAYETEDDDDEEEEDADEDLEEYVEEKVNESVDLCDTELLDNIYEPDQTDSEINQYENEDDMTNNDDDTEDHAMFTDILNSCCIDKNNVIFNLDNTIIYKSDEEENDEDDNGLDYLPVKDDENNVSKRSNKNKVFDYSEMLRFDSIHLPPPPPASQIPAASSDLKTPIKTDYKNTYKYTNSTLVAQRTKYLRQMNQYNMQMPFPPSNPLASAQFKKLSANLNYSSDTDSSIMHNKACCSGSLKTKWNQGKGSLQRLKQKINKTKEAPELTTSISNRNMTDEAIENDLLLRLTNQNQFKANTSILSNKKVKFQIK